MHYRFADFRSTRYTGMSGKTYIRQNVRYWGTTVNRPDGGRDRGQGAGGVFFRSFNIASTTFSVTSR